MITECVCDVEGCGERGRIARGQLPEGWLMIISFEKPKGIPKLSRAFPIEMDDMMLREHAKMLRMRKRAICGKHELPKFVIYDGREDEGDTLLGLGGL